MINKISSYTAANAIPVKLFMHEGVKQLRPIHINWYPTNICNLNCEFCSCANRNKQVSMDFATAVRVIHKFAELGCKSVSISGGGEPLCHPFLSDMIREFHECHIKIGLVTNGTLLNRLQWHTLDMLDWCRISASCEFTDEYRRVLDSAVLGKVDWAFSYVIGRNPDVENIKKVVNYAVQRNFTHVRLVGDLKSPESINWEPIRHALSGVDGFVIYQERKTFVPSCSCLVGYVKPLIAPDWKMYLCCGVQYAMEEMTLDNPPELCMGDARDLDHIYGRRQEPFQVNCVRCYYDNYNVALRSLVTDIAHKEFI